MRIVGNLPGALEIRVRDRWGATSLVGVAFLFIPVLFAYASESPTAGIRPVALLGLVTIGLLLILTGAPRAKRVTVRTQPVRIETEGTVREVGPGERLRLDGPPALSRLPGEYSVTLALEGASSGLTLVHARDPGEVLTDGLEIARFTGVPLEAGWGITSGSTRWALSARTSGGMPRDPETAVEDPEVMRRKLGLVAFLGALGAAGIFGLEIRTRVGLGETATPLSLVLACLCVALLIGFGVVFTTLRDSITTRGDKLVRERRILGVRVVHAEIPLREIISAHWIAPPGAASASQHLLLETPSGPVAWPRGYRTDPSLAAAITPGQIQECWRLPPS